MPKRIQLSRKKGWRKPANTVVVSRPSRWGNPYRWNTYPTWGPVHLLDGTLDDDPRRISDRVRQRWAVADFQALVEYQIGKEHDYPSHDEIRKYLRGKNLACWCAVDRPCHADVLLRIANA